MEFSDDASTGYIKEYQSLFTALETELLEVQHFYTQPNFNDAIDGVLSSDVFSLHKCLNDATSDDVVDSIPDLFELEDCLLDFVNDETTPEKMDSKTTGEINPLARIFRFKTKPRGRNVKRVKAATYDYLKSFWYGDGRFVAVYDGGKKSEDNGRRKKHKPWSTPEVLRLLDGVSELGVGRWMEIKRLFFSSSHHRTSVDLKDKWRNLLRASCRLPCVNLKGDWAQGNASNTTPDHILCRVRELSVTHPYPKKRQLKIEV